LSENERAEQEEVNAFHAVLDTIGESPLHKDSEEEGYYSVSMKPLMDSVWKFYKARMNVIDDDLTIMEKAIERTKHVHTIPHEGNVAGDVMMRVASLFVHRSRMEQARETIVNMLVYWALYESDRIQQTQSSTTTPIGREGTLEKIRILEGRLKEVEKHLPSTEDLKTLEDLTLFKQGKIRRWFKQFFTQGG
jgi:hypothetical protein